ncbi:MAG: peroxidase family protein [Planctomycetota bacterium]
MGQMSGERRARCAGRSRVAMWAAAGVLAALAGTATAGETTEYRSIDGTGNNLSNYYWGSAGALLRRDSVGMYSDGVGEMMSRTSARSISNAVGTQTAATDTNSRNLSAMWWQWGQFIDHDFAQVHGGTESASISVPMGDASFDPYFTGVAEISFTRSAFTLPEDDCRQHANEITSFVDASAVYGSDTARASALRSGVGGRMLTSDGDLLPFNTMGLDNDNATGNPGPLYAAGDTRANEVIGLTAMHTLFVREHNYWADQLAAQNPEWDDETLYQEARRVVGAQMQAITYNEFLPALLGEGALSDYDGYDDTVDATLSNEFSTAAYRLGHTMLNNQYLLLNEDGSEHSYGHVDLADGFFNPVDVMEQAGLDPIFRGLAAQQANEIDTQVVDGVRNFLFGPPGAGGLDLLALNIQRGRDHGIPDFNTLRQAFGLDAIIDFTDLTSDAALAAALATVYSDVSEIDPWIGLMAEDHVNGASVGETLRAILVDQFERMRDGDRFWYEGDAELAALVGDTTLSDIILRNTDIDWLQGNVFFAPAIPAPASIALMGLGGYAAMRRRRA